MKEYFLFDHKSGLKKTELESTASEPTEETAKTQQRADKKPGPLVIKMRIESAADGQWDEEMLGRIKKAFCDAIETETAAVRSAASLLDVNATQVNSEENNVVDYVRVDDDDEDTLQGCAWENGTRALVILAFLSSSREVS